MFWIWNVVVDMIGLNFIEIIIDRIVFKEGNESD